MKEITSLHVKPFHPENYSTIYDYDSYLDYNSRYNKIFLDSKRLKRMYGTKSSTLRKVKHHTSEIQLKFNII